MAPNSVMQYQFAIFHLKSQTSQHGRPSEQIQVTRYSLYNIVTRLPILAYWQTSWVLSLAFLHRMWASRLSFFKIVNSKVHLILDSVVSASWKQIHVVIILPIQVHADFQHVASCSICGNITKKLDICVYSSLGIFSYKTNVHLQFLSDCSQPNFACKRTQELGWVCKPTKQEK